MKRGVIGVAFCLSLFLSQAIAARAQSNVQCISKAEVVARAQVIQSQILSKIAEYRAAQQRYSEASTALQECADGRNGLGALQDPIGTLLKS